MNVLEALITLQNSIPENKTHHQMVRTILANLSSVRHSTIYEVADLCHTSTTSVGRLCTQLGFHSFGAFRGAVAETFEHYEFYNHLLPVNFENSAEDIHREISQIAQSHWETIKNFPVETIRQAAKILHEKENIHLFSHFPVSFVFMSLQENLIIDGKPSWYHLTGTFTDTDIRQTLSQKSAALFIIPDLHQETPLLDTYRAVLDAGADTIVIFTRQRSCWDGATLKIFLQGNSSLLDAHLSQYFLELLSCIYRAVYLSRH